MWVFAKISGKKWKIQKIKISDLFQDNMQGIYFPKMEIKFFLRKFHFAHF